MVESLTMNSSSCSPRTHVPSTDLLLDIATNITAFLTCVPQIYVLCRAKTSEGVSLITCSLTVTMLGAQLAAAILTKWNQIAACGDVGLARCIPDLLDEIQLVPTDIGQMVILVQVVLLPPTSTARNRALVGAIILGTACTWGGCVALSLVRPCGPEALWLSRLFGAA